MVQIGEQFGVAAGTVCGDLKRVRQAWRESSVRDFDELLSMELLKIERVEREAWAGWERLQTPQQTATVRGEGGPESEGQQDHDVQRGRSAVPGRGGPLLPLRGHGLYGS